MELSANGNLHLELENGEDGGSRANRSVSTSQNATNSHPLMFSPNSPVSPDYPDLIPEKSRSKVTFGIPDKSWFAPETHSSPQLPEGKNDIQEYRPFEGNLNFELPTLEEYNEQLPGKKNI